MEAIIILAPQLKWSDTRYECEWASPYFEKLPHFVKLPFLRNFRFWEITVFDKLSIFLYIYTAEELVGGSYYFSTATEMIGYPIWERMGTALFREITVFAKYPFWEFTVLDKIFFFICTFILQKSLLEAFIILAPQPKWSDTQFECEWAPPYFDKLPLLLNYRFWQNIDFFYLHIYTAEEIVESSYCFSTATEMIGYPIRQPMGTTLFWEITVFANYRFFICTFKLQKSLLEEIIILARQLKWSDTQFECEWAAPYFEKLPHLLNYRYCEITVFEKLPFREIIDFLVVRLYCRWASCRQLLF